ncbi:hypothetical protein OH799_31100 [Nocardia sp. NBC_00881]|nr:hypothetical protein OH799_31100 [Nocardia sp. NBC_00881]
MYGATIEDAPPAEKIGQDAWNRGSLMETSDSAEEVVELMPLW